jgi:hypothetical protein
MSPTDPTILVAMIIAAALLVTFWRKVLVLLLSIAIGVFFYGLINLTGLIHA